MLELGIHSMTGEMLAGIVFAAITFVVIPAILAVAEYRLAQQGKQQGLHLVIGVFASALLLGVYSLAVGVLLLIVRTCARSRMAIRSA